MSQEPALTAKKEPTSPVGFVVLTHSCLMPSMVWEWNKAGSHLQGAQGGRDVNRLSLSSSQPTVCSQGQGFGFSIGSGAANPGSCHHHTTILCSLGETNEKQQRGSAKVPIPTANLVPCTQKPPQALFPPKTRGSARVQALSLPHTPAEAAQDSAAFPRQEEDALEQGLCGCTP